MWPFCFKGSFPTFSPGWEFQSIACGSSLGRFSPTHPAQVMSLGSLAGVVGAVSLVRVQGIVSSWPHHRFDRQTVLLALAFQVRRARRVSLQSVSIDKEQVCCAAVVVACSCGALASWSRQCSSEHGAPHCACLVLAVESGLVSLRNEPAQASVVWGGCSSDSIL